MMKFKASKLIEMLSVDTLEILIPDVKEFVLDYKVIITPGSIYRQTTPNNLNKQPKFKTSTVDDDDNDDKDATQIDETVVFTRLSIHPGESQGHFLAQPTPRAVTSSVN